MSSTPISAAVAGKVEKLEKKPVKFSNLLLGAGLNLFEVCVSFDVLGTLRICARFVGVEMVVGMCGRLTFDGREQFN